MTDAHAKAVEAAAEALRRNSLVEMDLPEPPWAEVPDDLREYWLKRARVALAAADAAMRAEGWVLVRVPTELSTQMHPDDMDEDQIEDADWRYAYEKMVEGVAAMLGGADDER